MGKVGVEEWKAMFSAVGLSEEKMLEWHRVFEKRNPAGHQSFLEWLGLDEKRIAVIRAM